MKKTLGWYLARGCDRRTAEYLLNEKKAIKSIAAGNDITMCLVFADGEHRIFDCKPILKKGTVRRPVPAGYHEQPEKD